MFSLEESEMNGTVPDSDLAALQKAQGDSRPEVRWLFIANAWKDAPTRYGREALLKQLWKIEGERAVRRDPTFAERMRAKIF